MSFNKKSIAVLGSTGSIGLSTLKILNKHKKFFDINLLCCNQNKKKIYSQIKLFLPKFVIINDLNTYNFLSKIKFKKKIIFFKNVHEFVQYNKLKQVLFDKVILGISSIDGLDYAFSFIKFSKELLIANKETIVCGGDFFLKKAKLNNCNIKSIDSEHYCLSTIINNGNYKNIDRVYLTATGGPFLNKKFEDYSKINSKYAINHPKWKMGKKISIDSATMANKILEIIEASILFKIHFNKIKIKIHEEAKVHAIVVFKNGLAELVAHNTSMEIPIENSLLESNNLCKNNNFFLKKEKIIFTFDEVNLKKFDIITAGYKAIKYGHRACIFFNVINDCLVNKYLNNKIFFYEISTKLNKVFNNHNYLSYFKKKIKTINDIYETISYAKKIFRKI